MAHAPSDSPPDGRSRGRRSDAGATNRRDGNGRSKGLCVNCAYRDTCLLPRSEGGVWHCEKYAEVAGDSPGEPNGGEQERGMT